MIAAPSVRELFSFGSEVGDFLLASNDDGSAGPIRLQTGSFPFFGSDHNSIYVSNVCHTLTSNIIILTPL